MQFIKNNDIERIFEILLLKEFKVENYNKINDVCNKITSELEKNSKVNYGYISEYIKKLDPDSRDLLDANATLCIAFCDIPQVEDLNDIFMQIINHIILEVPRANQLDYIEDRTQYQSTQNREIRRMQRDVGMKIESFDSEFKNMKNEFNRFEDKIGNIQSEFIGILSIFAAIIISFIGGVQILGGVLNNLGNVNFYPMAMVTILIGLVLFNIIYMLLYTVSKIISKDIGIKIDKCKSCKNESSLKCLIYKYPVVFWINLISALSITLIFVAYNLDRYHIFEYVFTSFIWLMNKKRYLNIFLVMFSSSVVSLLFYKILISDLFKKLKNISCISYSNNNSESVLDKNKLNTSPELATSLADDN